MKYDEDMVKRRMDYTYERAIILANNLCYVVDQFLGSDRSDDSAIIKAMAEYDDYVNGDGLFELWRVAARDCGEYIDVLA